MPHHRTNRHNYKVWTDETEYLKWFNQYWANETKRINKQEQKRKAGRKPKGYHSLKVEKKTIILNFD